MISRRVFTRSVGVAALGVTAACAGPAGANNPSTSTAAATPSIGPGPMDGVVRTELQRLAAPFPGFLIVQTRTDIPSGKESGRHSHTTGPETGYILEGNVEVFFDDKQPVQLKAGDYINFPMGYRHNVRNIGTVTSMMLSVYVIDPNQPLVTFS